MLCKKCDGELDENALFCRFCGNKIEQETVSAELNKTNAFCTDEDFGEEPESDLSVNYSENSSDYQNIEDSETKDTIVSDKTSDEKNSKAKYAIISIALVAFVTIIGIVATAISNKKNDVNYAPEYNTVETERSTTEDTTIDTYDNINSAYSDEYVTVQVPDDTTKEKVVIADGGLKIRDLPSVEDGEKIGLIPNGSTIIVEKIDDGWAYTTYDDVSGWCSCEFLFDPTDYDGVPLYSAVVKPYEGLRLRTEAYINEGNIITVVPYAESVQVYEVDEQWAYISYNDIFGWCSTEYLD